MIFRNEIKEDQVILKKLPFKKLYRNQFKKKTDCQKKKLKTKKK